MNDLHGRIIVNNPFEKVKIFSYGLICHDPERDKYLLVRRSHTVQYLLLISCKFHKSQTYEYLSKITKKERYILGSIIGNKTKYSEECKKCRVSGNFEYISRYEEHINSLKNVICSSGKLTWTWPKGRKNPKESQKNCAVREVMEETGFVASPSKIDKNNFIEDDDVLNEGFKITNKYFLYTVTDESLDISVNSYEVSDVRWVDFKDLNGTLDPKYARPPR